MKTTNFKGDLFGGITAGIVALPLALAFGIQAFGGIDDPSATSIGALAGLVGATMLGFFASLFGGTHSQISGPTGPMTVITASLVSAAWASSGSLSTVLVSMSLAGLFCGLFQILFGVMKIGKYVRYIPNPVLSGFMSGIGVIIILQQLYPLIGMKSPVLVVDMVAGFPKAVASGVSLVPVALGLGTVAIIQLFPKVTKKIPSTLVALVVMTVISLFLDLDEKLMIGSIPSGVPMPIFFKEGISLGGIDWKTVIEASVIPGLTLSCLGSIDTLLTSVVADNITKTKHDSNQELIGQGIGNAVAGLFCGIAGAGATMRTVVNVRSGGRNKISGMIHSLMLLSILLGLGSLVKYVPLSVLAGILITVGWGIIDFRGFKDLVKVPRADAVVLMIVFLVTVFVDLLTAVAIGMVVACVVFMKNMGDIVEASSDISSMKSSDAESPWEDEGDIPQGIFVARLRGPLFFGYVTGFKNMLNSVPEGTRTVIIRMKRCAYVDQSGLYAMEDVIRDLTASGVEVMLTAVPQQPMTMLRNTRLVPGLVPESNVYASFEDCAEVLRSRSAS